MISAGGALRVGDNGLGAGADESSILADVLCRGLEPGDGRSSRVGDEEVEISVGLSLLGSVVLLDSVVT